MIWTYQGKDIKNVQSEYEDIILTTQVMNISDAMVVDKSINKLFGNTEVNGRYIQVGNGDGLIIPRKVTMSMADLSGAIKGSKVYIYRVNEATGKLDTIVGGYSSYINSDGQVTFSALDNGKYVVLLKKAESNNITSLKNQITLKVKKKAVTKGKTINITKLLPSCLQIVDNLKDKTIADNIGAVTITYTTSDKRIATVSKAGKVTGKKKGKVTIQAKVKLYNGTSKTVNFKITVK